MSAVCIYPIRDSIQRLFEEGSFQAIPARPINMEYVKLAWLFSFLAELFSKRN